MMKFNFDKLPNRRNTESYKWDLAKEGELPMWVADMDFEVFEDIRIALQKRLDINCYGYSMIPDAFYESICWWWDIRHHVKYDKSWLVYSSGVVAAISSMVRRLTNVGDKVIVQPPVYNVFYNSILNNKRVAVENPLLEKNGEFFMDFEDLEEKMKDESTKLMILCNPHNPVGRLWNKEELTKVGELANKYNVIVISDEIHCDITDPGYEYTPFLSVSEINKGIGVAAVSASKAFNLAGLQSACLIIPNEELRKSVDRGLNNDEVAECNFFSMDANIAAFSPRGAEYIDELNKYIYRNKQYFMEFVRKELPELKVIDSHATYLMWIDISNLEINSDEFASRLREQTGLFIAGGVKYHGDGDKYFRINLATSLDNVKDACLRLKTFVKSL